MGSHTCLENKQPQLLRKFELFQLEGLKMMVYTWFIYTEVMICVEYKVKRLFITTQLNSNVNKLLLHIVLCQSTEFGLFHSPSFMGWNKNQTSKRTTA